MTIFNISGYRSVISTFLDRGYKDVGFRDFTPAPHRFILRHDIDFSLACAVKQADVNADLGVSATFFFLISSEHYNLASREGRATLKHVSGRGQKIGLHLDVALYGPDPDLAAIARDECAILTALAETELEGVSFHRPVKALQGVRGLLANLPHAYEPRFFNEIEYCSDSQGRFYHGSPFDRDAFQAGLPMQLLLHPIWWMRDAEVEPLEAIGEVERERRDALRASFAANCRPFAKYLEAQSG